MTPSYFWSLYWLLHPSPNWYLMDAVIIFCSWNRAQTPSLNHREPNSSSLILSFHVGRTYRSSVVKPRQEQRIQSRTSTASERKRMMKRKGTTFCFIWHFCVVSWTNLERAAGRHGGSQRCQVDVPTLVSSVCLSQSLHLWACSKQSTTPKWDLQPWTCDYKNGTC